MSGEPVSAFDRWLRTAERCLGAATLVFVAVVVVVLVTR